MTKGYKYPPAIQAVYDHEQKMIRIEGCQPEVCPHCSQRTLWPKSHQVRNALSRFESKTYICPPCGRGEAGKLSEDAVELAEMEKRVDESDK